MIACGSIDPSESYEAGDGGSPGAAGASTQSDTPLLPWATGNVWTYRITKDGKETVKTNTIGALEPIGGIGPNAELMAYHLVTDKGRGKQDRTNSWQAPDPENPNRVVRYREQAFGADSGELEVEVYFEPSKLRIDGSPEHTTIGASWLESYSETELAVGSTPMTSETRERWAVIDDDAVVTVPAGTFEHTVHFQKTGGDTPKEYWYLRGVGKLKELGGQTEELMDYTLQDAEPGY